MIDNEELPIDFNVNFGHATPQCALQYSGVAKVDMKQKKIYVDRQERILWLYHITNYGNY